MFRADQALLTLFSLIKHVHVTVVTSTSDFPIVHSSSTPLETHHAALVARLAHEANFIMSVRGLSTGVAMDVSGVIRISKGLPSTNSQARTQDVQGVGTGEEAEENEMLFFIGADRDAKVWRRGVQSGASP